MEAEHWNRRYEGADFLWTAEPNRLLAAEVGKLAPGRALDLGCGEGRNAVWLAKRGWSVTGVDFSDVALEKARRLAEAESVSARWVLSDLRTFEPEPGAYDLSVLLYLHLPEPARRVVHAAAARALRAGGVAVLIGHDLTNLTEGFGGPQEASVLFTPEQVAREFPGLTVVRAERVRRRVATGDGERTAIDTLVRAVRDPSS